MSEFKPISKPGLKELPSKSWQFIKALFWICLAWFVTILSRLLMIIIMVAGSVVLGVFMLIYGTSQTAKILDMVADLFRKYRL